MVVFFLHNLIQILQNLSTAIITRKHFIYIIMEIINGKGFHCKRNQLFEHEM